jgi:type IV secretory pathway VirB3-like protein
LAGGPRGAPGLLSLRLTRSPKFVALAFALAFAFAFAFALLRLSNSVPDILCIFIILLFVDRMAQPRDGQINSRKNHPLAKEGDFYLVVRF